MSSSVSIRTSCSVFIQENVLAETTVLASYCLSIPKHQPLAFVLAFLEKIFLEGNVPDLELSYSNVQYSTQCIKLDITGLHAMLA